MNKFAANLLLVIAFASLGACSKQAPSPAPAGPAAPQTQSAPQEAQPAAPATSPSAAAEPAEESAPTVPVESVSETDDPAEPGDQPPATVQPSLRLGGPASSPPTSERFKEGTNYRKLVPAQPTGAAPGKVEVVEVFWYGCGHCFALDPAIDSWRGKSKAPYVEFVRLPAMWNDATRMHARLFYTAELLGKLDSLHPLIFREIHVNGNQLNDVDKIAAFFKQHGVGAEELNKAFSSFAVESKLQRADFLNRRYRVQSVPMVVVNGKYTTDVTDAGGEPKLFALIDELAAHEHGG